MSKQTSQFDFGGCVSWAVENGTFLLGMALMFSKTVDLMSTFAPRTIFGYTGLAVFYGLAVGLLVEGALFVMKLTLPRAKKVVDWLWTVAVVVLPFAISGFAQVIDSIMVRQTLDQQPDWVQFMITWGVPSIPTAIIFLLIGKSIFSSVPQEIMPNWMTMSRPSTEFSLRLPPFPWSGRKESSEPVHTGVMIGSGPAQTEVFEKAVPPDPTQAATQDRSKPPR